MFKLSAILLLLFAVYYSQSVPAQSTSVSTSNAESGEQLQLYVHNGTKGINYHLAPLVKGLENEDKQINAELDAVRPFLNFMMDSGASAGQDCMDELIVQIVQN